MQKRSTSAYVTNQDLYRSPDAFLSSLPMERRYLRSAQTTHSILWNTSNQALRLSKEWTEKLESRVNKRTSQVMGHRVDKLYMMNGNAVKLQPRYDVTDEEIRHLKQLAKTREEMRAETRQSKHLILIPESEDSGEGLSQGEEGIEVRVGGEAATRIQPQAGESGLKEPTSLSMRAASPESGFQGEDRLSSVVGGLQDSAPGEPPAARPPSMADLSDQNTIPVLSLESEPPKIPNQVPEVISDTNKTPKRNENSENTGVTVSDILSHRNSTTADLGTVNKMESEGLTKMDREKANASGTEREEELTPRDIARSLCLQPGEGCYSLIPDNADGYNNMRKWYADYTSYPYWKMSRWNKIDLRLSGKFPVRKPNLKLNSPALCECECRRSSVFLSLQGVQVPTTCKH